MMWNPFKKETPVTFRHKELDWSKVTTLDEVICILSKLRILQNPRVDESEWNDPKIKHLLGNVITETTYYGFEKTIKVYKENE